MTETKIGKSHDGMFSLQILRYSRKGNLKKSRTHYLGSKVHFLRIENSVLIAYGKNETFTIPCDTIISQGMLYETAWPKHFIGKTLRDIMEENIVYDRNLNPKTQKNK